MSNSKQSPSALAIAAFGGVNPLARALGIHASTVSRWQHGRGLVPAKHQARVLEQAWAAGYAMTAHDIIFGRPNAA